MKRCAELRPGAALVGLGFVLASSLVGVPARAQSSGGSSQADIDDQAATLFETGAKAARLEDARTFYLSALRIKPFWQIAAALGETELALGKKRDAAEHLDYALRSAPASLSPDKRQRLQEMFETAKVAVGAIKIRVSSPGAEVFIDGKLVDPSPLGGPIYVEPGERAIEARRGKAASRTVTVAEAAGSSDSVELTLLPEEAPSASTQPTSCQPVVVEMRRLRELPPRAGDGAASRALFGVGLGTSIALVLGPAAGGLALRKAGIISPNEYANLAFYSAAAVGVAGIATNAIGLALVNSPSVERPHTPPGLGVSVGAGNFSINGTF